MRGITLEEIAEATKIGTRSLRALEEEEFDKLPGGIFNKGFVRAYARYLGIDEEQAVADYITAVGEAQSAGKLQRPEAPESASPEKNLGNIQEDEAPRVPPMLWGALAILVIVAVAGFAGARYVARHGWPQLRRAQAASTQSPPAATPSAAKVAETAPPPVTAPPATTTAAAAPTTSDPTRAVVPFFLRVHAKKDAWVLLIVDGKEEMSGILAADAEKAVRAEKRVVFKTGDAAAIELFHNDKLLPPLGEEGQVKQVTITAQGLQLAKSNTE